jgi:hypothetical protein
MTQAIQSKPIGGNDTGLAKCLGKKIGQEAIEVIANSYVEHSYKEVSEHQYEAEHHSDSFSLKQRQHAAAAGGFRIVDTSRASRLPILVDLALRPFACWQGHGDRL